MGFSLGKGEHCAPKPLQLRAELRGDALSFGSGAEVNVGPAC